MTESRLIQVESRVTRLEDDVTEIKTGVKELLERPQSAAYGQAIGLIATTLVVCGLIFGFAEWRLLQAVSPVQSQILELKKEISVGEQKITNLKINSAVMEERVGWVKSMTGWHAQLEKVK